MVKDEHLPLRHAQVMCLAKYSPCCLPNGGIETSANSPFLVIDGHMVAQ
jgi:hypothetical protein